MRKTTPVLGLAVVLLVGCTADGDGLAYNAARYRSGDCKVTSRLAFEIDEAVKPVVAGDTKPARVVDDLKALQKELIDAVPGIADAKLRDGAQDVVDAVGFYRIGIDAEKFTPELAKNVATASRRFLSSCSVN
ncbi:MAG TPA: hypothetical protein VNB94_07640 [Mycobacteriales bacterium]|nr:hypothetical protein [Mycobacteriales bacterium]